MKSSWEPRGHAVRRSRGPRFDRPTKGRGVPTIRPKVPPLFVGCLVLIVVLVCCSGIVRSCRKWMDGRAQASAEGETSETEAPPPPPVVEPDTVYGTPDQFARAPLMTNVRVVIENLRTGEPAKGRGTEALADPGARVHVLLQCRRGGEGGNTYYSNAPQAYWANTLIPADMLQPWPEDEFGPLNIRWYKVEPTDVSLSNRRGGTFSMAELEYVESPVLEWANEWTVPGDVTPVAHEPSLPGYGTMRYKVSVALANTQGEITKSLESRGKDAMLTVGISPEVPRLSLRPDDTFLGWLFAWGNVPYIFASASDRGERNTERHQTELFIGADGPDLIYGAMRKMGKNVRYSNTYGLENVTRTIYDSIDPAGPGVYESDGRRVQWSAEGVLPGDIVLWGEHAAVLLRDGPGRSEGELDVDDMVIHTHEAPPSQTTLARAWRTRRISILRPSFGG